MAQPSTSIPLATAVSAAGTYTSASERSFRI